MAARRVARSLGVVRHLEVPVDLAAFGGSALTGDGVVPEGPAAGRRRASPRPTCRPATPCCSRWRSPGPRCWARATSSSGSTPSTTRAIRTVVRSSSRPSSGWRRWPPRPAWRGRRLSIHAPLITWSKAEIIRRKGSRSVSTTGSAHSCYDPVDGRPSVRTVRQLSSAGARVRGGGCARSRAGRSAGARPVEHGLTAARRTRAPRAPRGPRPRCGCRSPPRPARRQRRHRSRRRVATGPPSPPTSSSP